MSDPAGSEPMAQEVALCLLQSAEHRRQAIDQMMWQVPGLSLTAQSFLLTISLGHYPAAARAVSGLLGLAASLAAVQLLLKHRFYERQWSQWLERFATERGWALMHDRERSAAYAWERESGGRHAWHDTTAERSRLASSLWRSRSWLVERKSPNVWVTALLLFGLADLGAAVYGLAGLAGFP